jgi:hypothetical protein
MSIKNRKGVTEDIDESEMQPLDIDDEEDAGYG